MEQKVDERLGSLELVVESLRVLMERHLIALSADTSRATTTTDAQSVEFVRETRERVDAVASQLEDVLPHVHAYRDRFHALVSEASASADEERIGRTRR